VLIYDLTIAGSGGNSTDYVKALDAFAAAFPDDPALEIMRISQATFHKRFADALAQIARLDKRVGGDPYLDAERANIYLMARNFPDALQHAKRATEQAPDLPDGWEALLDTHIASKNFADAVKTLADMRARKVPFDPTADAYRALIESQEYKTWLEANPP
jgi:predicted Zn-dependent protease